MTSKPGNLPEVSEDEARRLRAEGDRLLEQSARLGAQADLLHARSELTSAVIARRAMLDEAAGQLAQARDDLARLTAQADNVTADLTRVLDELDSLDTSAGSLDDQLAAHSRHYALTQVAGPVRARAVAAAQQAQQARDLVRSLELQEAAARDDLARAAAALLDPPLDDMSELCELAPYTAMSRIRRVGLAMVNAANASTPHAYYVAAGVREFMAATGQLALYESYVTDRLRRSLDSATFARVMAALDPPADQPVPAARELTPEQVKSDLRNPAGVRELDLPGYTSEAAARVRRTERAAAAFQGPGSWPSFGGIRTPRKD